MTIDIYSSIASIEKCLREANNYFMLGNYGGDESIYDKEVTYYISYYTELAFFELLVLVEHLNLPMTYQMIVKVFNKARDEGYMKSEMGLEEPYLVWIENIRMFVDGISGVHGLGKTDASELRELKAILKRAVYVICDNSLFPSVPGNESDVHRRIEGILKAYYQDLKRKPVLSKPIKNFEPDTGIPSIKTLIEYKFVKTNADAKRVADEILTDVSGYRSPEWKNILFVIYETHRVMPEDQWISLIKECGLGRNYDAIVLSGDAIGTTTSVDENCQNASTD